MHFPFPQFVDGFVVGWVDAPPEMECFYGTKEGNIRVLNQK